MEIALYVLAFFIFLGIPYLTLFTLAVIWWVARKIKNTIVAIVKYFEHPIN